MLVSFYFISLTYIALGASRRKQLNSEGTLTDLKIVGGTPVGFRGAIPYQVSLQEKGKHFCGGSVVSGWHILTAAHCVYRQDWISRIWFVVKTNKIRAWIGSTNIKGQGLYVNISNIYVHNFKPGWFNNRDDISLLKTSQKMEFDGNVNAIELATMTPTNGTKCFVSGFGKLQHGATEVSEQLMVVENEIYNWDDCKKIYRSHLTRKMVCAGGVKDKGACQGDSGGPLVCGSQQVGIVSFGRRCGQEDVPTVYTSVAAYKDWIGQKMGKAAKMVPLFYFMTVHSLAALNL